MKREEILNTAGRLISQDRAATYGDAKESHQRIADLWATYLGVSITAKDVAALMVLLKISRSKGAKHVDNWIDVAGYAALAGEMEDGVKKDGLRADIKPHTERESVGDRVAYNEE